MRKAVLGICLLLPISQAAVAYQAQATVKPKHLVSPQSTLPAQAKQRLLAQPVTPPYSATLACTSSKSVTLPSSRQGLGCRETPKAIWQTQGCPSNIGCCDVPGNPTASCLVISPSSTDTVRGNGIY